MPSKGKKFISQFLLPNLYLETFGSKLKWVDAEKTKFQLQWSHKSGADWKEADAIVFTEWDKMKGHYRPKEKEYFTKSKQRFRAVLYKLMNEKLISEVPSTYKNTKIYHIKSRDQYKWKSVGFYSSYEDQNSLVNITKDHSYSLNKQDNPDMHLHHYPANLIYFECNFSREEQIDQFQEACDEFLSLDNSYEFPNDEESLYQFEDGKIFYEKVTEVC